MAKSRSADPQKETTPTQFPEVVPPTYADSVGMGALIEMMMLIQHSLGEMKSTVAHLKSASDSQSTKLDRLSHQIYAATVVLFLLLAVGGFLINKYWDPIIGTLFHKSGP